MISGKIVELRGISKQDAPLIYEWVNREDMRDLTDLTDLDIRMD